MKLFTFQAEPVVEQCPEGCEHDHAHEEPAMPPMTVRELLINTYAQKPKVTKNEKKARKAILAYDVEEIPDIMRATFKRDEKTYLFVDRPTIYKSKTQNIYIVFGVIRIDNGENNAFLQQAASEKFQAPEEEEAEKPAEEQPAEAEEEVVDETGINPDDVNFVIEQTKCTYAQAVKALRENDNDMINAVMSLGK